MSFYTTFSTPSYHIQQYHHTQSSKSHSHQHNHHTHHQTSDSALTKQKNQQNDKLLSKQRSLFESVYIEPLKKIEHNINVLIQCGSIAVSLQPITQYDSFELYEFSGDSILAKEFSDRTTKYPGASPYICTLFKSHGCSNDTLTFFYHLLNISSKLLDPAPTIPKKQADIMEAMIHELYHAQNHIARSTLEMFILMLLQYTNITFHHTDSKLCAEVSAINNNSLLHLFDTDSYLKSISLAKMTAVPILLETKSAVQVPVSIPIPVVQKSISTSIPIPVPIPEPVPMNDTTKLAPVSLKLKLESHLQLNTFNKPQVIYQKQSKLTVNTITDGQLLSPYTLGYHSVYTSSYGY